MNKLLIEKKINITAAFEAADWHLDLDNEHVEEVAAKLNERLEFLVNNGFNRWDTYSRMSQFLEEISAHNPQTRAFISHTLDDIYS